MLISVLLPAVNCIQLNDTNNSSVNTTSSVSRYQSSLYTSSILSDISSYVPSISLSYSTLNSSSYVPSSSPSYVTSSSSTYDPSSSLYYSTLNSSVYVTSSSSFYVPSSSLSYSTLNSSSYVPSSSTYYATSSSLSYSTLNSSSYVPSSSTSYATSSSLSYSTLNSSSYVPSSSLSYSTLNSSTYVPSSSLSSSYSPYSISTSNYISNKNSSIISNDYIGTSSTSKNISMYNASKTHLNSTTKPYYSTSMSSSFTGIYSPTNKNTTYTDHFITLIYSPNSSSTFNYSEYSNQYNSIMSLPTKMSNYSYIDPYTYNSTSLNYSSTETSVYLPLPTDNDTDVDPLSYSNLTIIPYDNPFMILAYQSPCTDNHAEVVQKITYGWKSTSTTGFGWVVGDMIDDLVNQESQSGNDNSFTGETQRGGLKCGMWSGAMVSNSDTLSSIASSIKDNLHNEGIPNGKFYEYVSSDSDPMKGFGIYCQVNVNEDDVSAAIKGWSQGKSASQSVNGISGTSSLGDESLCYTSYSGRKSGNLDKSLGKCNTATISDGQTASDACGISGDSLSYYNKGVDFGGLVPGDEICCSIGDGTATDTASSYKCNSGDSKSILTLDYGWQTTDTTSFGWVVADIVSDIMDYFRSHPNEFTSFKQRGGLRCGCWSGAMFDISSSANSLQDIIRKNLQNEGIPSGKYFEYISSDKNPMKVFGLYCTANGNAQDPVTAVKGWSEGKSASSVVSGISGTSSIKRVPSCFTSYSNRRPGAGIDPNLDTCDYHRIEKGQSASDACNGLTGDNLEYYNKNVNINQIFPKQPICCSIGQMPDFRPHENSDGSCFEYTIGDGDTCTSIMAQYYPLSEDDLMNFNKQTFGWMGCSNGHPWKNDKICLSTGKPPRPSVNPNAECGPQAPGDKYNSECPLNACCSEYGFCGFGKDFCGKKDSPTGAPGTAGCLSNCDDVSFSGESTSWESVSYFDGTKASNLEDYDGEYDAIHLAFADVANDHGSISTNQINEAYNNLKNMGKTSKKVLSIGGWDFSTDSSTYNILRDAIENDYDHFANVVVSFMQQPENSFLTGFDIDWEYPGEPDIPGIPPDSNKNVGDNYVEFVKAVRLRMDRSKTLSMAIPSSYWYLKNFKIKELSEWVDYFIFMTYDLHGQWDYSEKYSGGPHTHCHTDIVETEQALKMIVKAGVPESKIRVGIANYARTYGLQDTNCNGDGCLFLGPQSAATAGPETNTRGILSINEINNIVKDQSRVNNEFNNDTSKCTYLRYDSNQWAAWSTDNSQRANQYKSWGFGGTSLWVANYDKGSNSGNNDSGNNNNDDDNDDNDEFYTGDVGYYVFGNLIDNTCWDKYKNIDNEKDLNNVETDCSLDASIAYLMNEATNAVNYLTNIIPGGKDNDKYKNDFKGYSSYFAHNMSHAYQEWSYANINNENWFSCLDNNGNSVGCGYALEHDFTSPCHDNCCPGIGCTKTQNGVTVEDKDTENGKCLKDSVLESCCKSSSSNPTNKRINSNVFKYVKSIYKPNNFKFNNPEYQPNVFDPIQAEINNITNILISDGGYTGYGANKDEENRYNSTEFSNITNNITNYNSNKNSLNKRSSNINLFGWIVKNNDALEQFSDYVGYNIRVNEMYTQPFYRFQKLAKNDPEQICFNDEHNNITVRCYDLPRDQLFNRDPIQYIDQDLLNKISGVVSNMRTALDNKQDYHFAIFDASGPALIQFIDSYESVKTIREIGHNYNSRCDRLRVMEIIGPLLIALSVLTMFLDPIPALIADLSLTAIGIAVNPDHDPTAIIEQLAGSLAGVFGIIGKLDKGRFGQIAKRADDNVFNPKGKTASLISNKVKVKGCLV